MTNEESDSSLEVADPAADESSERAQRKKKKTQKRKRTFSDLSPEQQEKVREKRRKRKSTEQKAAREADAESEGDERESSEKKRATGKKKRKKTSKIAQGDPGEATGKKKKKKKRRTTKVAGQMEQVDLEQRPDTRSVKPRKGRVARKPGEEEQALASLEDDDDLMPSPFAAVLSDSGESPASAQTDDASNDDWDELEDESEPSEAASEDKMADEEVLNLDDSNDLLEGLIRTDGEDAPEPRKKTARRTGRMKPGMNDDAEENKKVDPRFLAAFIGIPLILVILMTYWKFGRGNSAPDKGGDRVEDTRAVGVTGSRPQWEKAVNKAQDAKEQYQKTVRAAGEAEDVHGEIKEADKGPLIDGYEKARTLINESLAFCAKMLEEYKKEQKEKNPKIKDAVLEHKLRNSRYGDKERDWEILKKDILFQLQKLRGHRASKGSSEGR